MAVKVPYFYTVYEDCPRATKISRNRARNQTTYLMLCIISFLMSLFFCFVDSSDRWFAICSCVILCPLWFVYLIVFYDKVTDRKIKKALKKQEKLNAAYESKNVYSTIQQKIDD